jgi:hypothetical protein
LLDYFFLIDLAKVGIPEVAILDLVLMAFTVFECN